MTSLTIWLRRFVTGIPAALLVLIGLPAQGDETITYIHWDALGSPVAATDEAGNVVWRESYRPYGARVNHEAAAGPHTRWYTGHPQDADTELVYAGARYYDPVIGRFLSRDPVDFRESNVHSFNRYAYGNNNPYRYVDPDGRVNIANWRISGGRGSSPGSIAHWGGSPKIPSSISGGRGAPVETGTRGAEQRALTPGVTKGTPKLGDSSIARGQRGAVGSSGPRKLSKVRKETITEDIAGGRFTRKKKIEPGRGPGQSRAELHIIRNRDDRVIRTFKDSFDRAGRFQHRKFLRGGPEGRLQ